MNRTKTLNVVAFYALMEKDGGIFTKSPDYIAEKFERYCTSDRDETKWGLDSSQLSIVSSWRTKWMKHDYDG